MNKHLETSRYIDILRESVQKQDFVSLTLSKYVGKESELKNIYARIVDLKNEDKWSFTFRYLTRDEVKNHSVEEGLTMIALWLGNDFLNATFFTDEEEHSLLFNKKRKPKLFSKKNKESKSTASKSHDKEKQRLIKSDSLYLKRLGISSTEGHVLKSGQRKFKQINKYIELVDGLLKESSEKEDLRIVDMGCGKGYLTFALYDFLKEKKERRIHVTGVELREGLVQQSNALAKESSFDHLEFVEGDIASYEPQNANVLIALHACDIATDMALAKGIQAEVPLIVVAPCCHKQIRKAMNTKSEMQAVLKHGILEERQAELITDGIRALLLEANGYRTKVFEFISVEHTPKNVMIVGIKDKARPEAIAEIAAIKKQYGIAEHYLEKLLI